MQVICIENYFLHCIVNGLLTRNSPAHGLHRYYWVKKEAGPSIILETYLIVINIYCLMKMSMLPPYLPLFIIVVIQDTSPPEAEVGRSNRLGRASIITFQRY